MYTKISFFSRTSSSLQANEKKIHQFLRNLCTAVERFDFGISNGESQNRTETESVHTQSQSWGFNQGRHEQQSPSLSQYQGNWYGTNSDYQNSGTSWHSGYNTFDSDVYEMIDKFDAFCQQEHLKGSLTIMEKLEKKGYVMDLARLLRLAELCSEGNAFQEASDLEEGKVSVQGKIRAIVYNVDANYLKYYTDYVIGEFDAFCGKGKVKKALYSIDTLASMNHVVDLNRLLRFAKLCGEAEAVQEAKSVHGKINASGCRLDLNSHHVLLEMYSNCGLANEAASVFEGMSEKSIETWSIMIKCLAKNGLGEDAIDMFSRFKNEGNKPDSQLFRNVFYACGVLGDVDEGLLHFESMFKDYGIVPSIEDYVSLVEMYALTGFLEEALEFIEKMPVEANADVWETLMNLSRVHGDLALGDRCAEIVELLDPKRLSKQCKEGFLPVKASDVEKECLKKMSGIHALQGSKSRLHEYRAGDSNLPENDELYELLRNLKMHMIERGYVVNSRPVLHDIDEESKETAVLGHSERTAFARAVLNSPPRQGFTVIKNLRVCVDCHHALKLMGDIVGRKLIMRDLKRYHTMENGVCNCNDYW